MNDMRELRAHIMGRVQGVFFRANAKANADTLGLVGYAENAPDGSLRIVAQGSEGRLKVFEDFCRMGPSEAEIEHVDITWGGPDGTYVDFDIRG